jgi:hypothetical protein
MTGHLGQSPAGNSTYNLCRASRSFKYVRTFVHLTSRTAAQVVAAKRYR